MSAGVEPWARIRHVDVAMPEGKRGERAQRRLLPWLTAAALFCCACALLVGSSSQQKSDDVERVQLGARAKDAAAAIPAANGHDVHPAVAAAEAAGLVQTIGAANKARMAYSALKISAGAAGHAGVVAGKYAAEIKAAAVVAVRTHILAEAEVAGNETGRDGKYVGSFSKEPSALADAPQAEVDATAKAYAVTPMLMSTGPDVNKDKVLVKLYMESQCPACRKFSTTYLKDIVEAPGMSDIMDLEYVPFGYGKVLRGEGGKDNWLNHTSQLLPLLQQMTEPWKPKPEFKIMCQHGVDECYGNALESCLQDVQPDMKINFPVFDCIEHRGCAEGMKPPDCVASPSDVGKMCVMEKGQGKIDVPQLLQCIRGSRAQELMVMNDVATLNANIQWAPWVTVDGEDLIEDPNNPNATTSFREMFLLGKKICDTYVIKTGKEPPASCAKLPQTDADIPLAPYDKYPKANFTELIAKLKAEDKLQAEQQKTLLQEQEEEQYLGVAKMALAPVLLVMAGAILAYFVCRSRQEEPKNPETEKLVGDKNKSEEHV